MSLSRELIADIRNNRPEALREKLRESEPFMVDMAGPFQVALDENSEVLSVLVEHLPDHISSSSSLVDLIKDTARALSPDQSCMDALRPLADKCYSRDLTIEVAEPMIEAEEYEAITELLTLTNRGDSAHKRLLRKDPTPAMAETLKATSHNWPGDLEGFGHFLTRSTALESDPLALIDWIIDHYGTSSGLFAQSLCTMLECNAHRCAERVYREIGHEAAQTGLNQHGNNLNRLVNRGEVDQVKSTLDFLFEHDLNVTNTDLVGSVLEQLQDEPDRNRYAQGLIEQYRRSGDEHFPPYDVSKLVNGNYSTTTIEKAIQRIDEPLSYYHYRDDRMFKEGLPEHDDPAGVIRLFLQHDTIDSLKYVFETGMPLVEDLKGFFDQLTDDEFRTAIQRLLQEPHIQAEPTVAALRHERFEAGDYEPQTIVSWLFDHPRTDEREGVARVAEALSDQGVDFSVLNYEDLASTSLKLQQGPALKVLGENGAAGAVEAFVVADRIQKAGHGDYSIEAAVNRLQSAETLPEDPAVFARAVKVDEGLAWAGLEQGLPVGEEGLKAVLNDGSEGLVEAVREQRRFDDQTLSRVLIDQFDRTGDGSARSFERLLRFDVPLDRAPDGEDPPLVEAADNAHRYESYGYEYGRKLLQKGADPNVDNGEVLARALDSEALHWVELLIEAGFNVHNRSTQWLMANVAEQLLQDDLRESERTFGKQALTTLLEAGAKLPEQTLTTIRGTDVEEVVRPHLNEREARSANLRSSP